MSTPSSPYSLPLPLRVARLRLTYLAERAARLPSHTSDRWRGAFGRALQEVSCPLPTGPDCNPCPVRTACPYALLFEPNLLPASRNASPPRPYALELLRHPQAVEAKEALHFDLVLFGNAIDALEQFLPVFHRAGQQGIHWAEEGALRLTLAAIDQQDNQEPERWHRIFDGVQFHGPAPSQVFAPPSPRGIRIDLITPLGLKRKGRRIQPEEFSLDLLRRRLRQRILDLTALYESAPDPATLERISAPRLPEGLTVTCDDLHAETITHISARAKMREGTETLQFSGLMGSIHVSGELEPIWPTLWLGTWTHAGNETAEGLGQYRIVFELGRSEPFTRWVWTRG